MGEPSASRGIHPSVKIQMRPKRRWLRGDGWEWRVTAYGWTMRNETRYTGWRRTEQEAREEATYFQIVESDRLWRGHDRFTDEWNGNSPGWRTL